MTTRRFFTTAQQIPASGIYRVRHDQHRVADEVTLLKGRQFPRCSKCGDHMLFELLAAAPDIFSDPDFTVIWYELVELPDVEELDRRKASQALRCDRGDGSRVY